jgi:plasmid stabilization system protein ParE
MKIVFLESFSNKLDSQVDYISKDSPKRARLFRAELIAKVREVAANPMLCRKSIYFNDNKVKT